MPRDGSGNYTLPAGINPVVGGTAIMDTWANPTLNDIATQLNNVVTRDGLLGMTAPFKLQDGTVSLPGLSWALEASSGMYRPSAGVIGFATLSAERLRIGATGNVTISSSVAGGNLDFSFNNSSNTASSNARAIFGVAGSSANDPSLIFDIAGVTSWAVGADNSDSDKFKISRGAVLGTTDVLSIDSGGSVTIAAPSSGNTLSVTTTGVGTAFNAVFPAATTSVLFNGTGSTTGAAVGSITNTGASLTLGVESSVGGAVFPASTAYATVIGNSTNTPILFYANNALRLTVGATGGATIAAPTGASVALTLTGNTAANTVQFNGGSSGSFSVSNTGLPFGTSIHNNPGSFSGTGNQYICSGTYTPTAGGLFGVANVVPELAQWMRVGNVVTVSGQVTFDGTAGGAIFTLSLPIPSSFVNSISAAGTGYAINGTNTWQAYIISNSTSDTAWLTGLASATVAYGAAYSYTYLLV